MNEWISVKDEKPNGACLVLLEEMTLHNIMHTAVFENDFQVVGGRFVWDMPRVTHWMPLPSPPEGEDK